MSDVRFTPVDEVERETAREPAKAWRNWYFAPVRAFSHELGLDVGPGPYPHPQLYPTREEAAQSAEEKRRGWKNRLRELVGNRWLGAFPEGDTP